MSKKILDALLKIQDQIIDNVRKECLEKNAGGKS
jgi:hypothetical protein